MSHHKHLFLGSENRSALITQFQLFAVASGDEFLGNVKGARLTTVSMNGTAIIFAPSSLIIAFAVWAFGKCRDSILLGINARPETP
jgi:hypothetical protein